MLAYKTIKAWRFWNVMKQKAFPVAQRSGSTPSRVASPGSRWRQYVPWSLCLFPLVSVGDTWLTRADTADVSCSSVFSFTSFVKQCRHPDNNLLKSVQHLCHLRFCYATERWLCLGKPRESVWAGFTKHSMLPAGCRWSEITYPLLSTKSSG